MAGIVRPGDWLLLAAALLLEGILIGRYWAGATPGAAVARVEGPAGVIRIALDQPREHTIDGHLGPSTLRVSQGAIAFVDSPCRQKICIRRGPLRRQGSSHACVPNRISLSIASSGPQSFDAFHH